VNVTVHSEARLRRRRRRAFPWRRGHSACTSGAASLCSPRSLSVWRKGGSERQRKKKKKKQKQEQEREGAGEHGGGKHVAAR